MIKNLYEVALKVRVIIYVAAIITLLLTSSKSHAFWPPDMVPHPSPPEMPQEPDDKMI